MQKNWIAKKFVVVVLVVDQDAYRQSTPSVHRDTRKCTQFHAITRQIGISYGSV